MPIKVLCKCGAKFNARDQLAGTDVECVSCGASLRVPPPSAHEAGGWSGGVMATFGVMGLALVGCGVMLYMLQDRVKTVQADLAAQQTRSAELQAISAEMRAELARNTTEDRKSTEDMAKEKAHLAEVQATVQAGAAKRQSLADALDKLDVETVRVRGEIQGLEQQRRAALAETATKRTALDRQLADLRTELAAKASAQDAARIQGEITRVEQAKDALVAQAAANKTKIDTYDRQIRTLEDDLRAKVKDQNDLLKQLADAQTKLTALTADADALKAVDLPNQVMDLKRQMAAADRPERYRTIVAEQSGVEISLRMDTTSGQTILTASRAGSFPSLTSPIFDPGMGAAAGLGGQDNPGRFDLNVTYNNGDVGDIIRLDTEEGRVWRCDWSTGVLRWDEMAVWAPRVRPGAAQQWSLSVSTPGSSGASTHPVVVLTRSDGTVVDNALTPNFFVPRLP